MTHWMDAIDKLRSIRYSVTLDRARLRYNIPHGKTGSLFAMEKNDSDSKRYRRFLISEDQGITGTIYIPFLIWIYWERVWI